MIQLKDGKIIDIKDDSHYEDSYYSGCTTCGMLGGGGATNIKFILEDGDYLELHINVNDREELLDVGKVTVFLIRNLESFKDITCDDFELLLEVLFDEDYYHFNQDEMNKAIKSFTNSWLSLTDVSGFKEYEHYIKLIKNEY